jgi:hypothetical protein
MKDLLSRYNITIADIMDLTKYSRRSIYYWYKNNRNRFNMVLLYCLSVLNRDYDKIMKGYSCGTVA